MKNSILEIIDKVLWSITEGVPGESQESFLEKVTFDLGLEGMRSLPGKDQRVTCTKMWSPKSMACSDKTECLL